MVIKVGINGFGRVGRVVFRTCLQTSDIEITAINDPAIEVDYIAYLIKYDSTHGKLQGNVSHTDEEIKINGHNIKVFRQKYPVNIPWSVAGVQYVVEASGMFTSMEKALGHLASDSVRRVIVTAPSVDVPMIVIGVNDNRIEIEQRVISCGSSTLYCLAPIIKLLEDHYGVDAGFITSIHAMTPSLKPLDGLCLRGKHWRDHRSIIQNIIPATTGACKALGKIIPQVRDKLTGLAFRVPIVNVSVLDLTIRVIKPASIQEIMRIVERVSKTTMRNIIKISKDETVSSDYMDETHSCVVDSESSLQLDPHFLKIICWYENEYSYACRVVDLIHLSEKQFENAEASKLIQLKSKLLKQKDVVLQTEDNIKITEEITYASEPETKSTEKKNLRPLPRPVLLKKPLILHHNAQQNPAVSANNSNKKKVEIFKIWNDDHNKSIDAVRQNRGAFFQACSNSEGSNTQERLEKVKEEFSKMVSITELLLKKSYNNKLPFNFEPLKENKQPITSKETEEPVQEKSNRKLLKLDMSGDGRMSDCTVHFDCSKETVQPVSDKNTSDYSMVETINSSHSKYKSSLLNLKVSSVYGDQIAKGDAKNSATKTTMPGNGKLPDPPPITFNSQMTKTFSNIIKNFQFCNKEPGLKKQHKNIPNNETRNESKKNNADDNVHKVIAVTSESSVDPEKSAVNNTSDFSADYHSASEQTESVQRQCTEHVKKNRDSKNVYGNLKSLSSIDRLDIELKRRNIILVDEQRNGSEVEKTISEKDNLEKEDRFQEQMEIKEEVEINLHASMPRSSFISQSISTKSPSVEKKQDIYDKLDSPLHSGSESDHSLNTKKSQVIHISDLTNSLDDLERLDKICRIIEISDELSDQLFQPLDNYNDGDSRTKRWSFKDLCDKICLDEFCEHVFGKCQNK